MFNGKPLEVGYHAPGSLSELQSIKPKIGDIFVVDDLFDISSKTHQLLFIQWYKSFPSMCKIVALSNCCPDSINPFSSVYRLKRHYKPIDVSNLKPAMPRRIGFISFDEAKCIVKTNGGWVDMSGKEFSLDEILVDWVRSDSGAAYPMVLGEMPNPMPFTAKDADIWFETSDEAPGLKEVLKGIMKGCSFRAARTMVGYDIDSLDVTSMGSTISWFAYLIAKKIQDRNIFARVGTRCWYD